MKKNIWWLAVNGGFAITVWLGFIEGVEGAQYLAKFFVFAVSVPLGLIGFSNTLQKKLAAEQPTPTKDIAKQIISWFALVVFVWFGHIVTAVAWLFWMLASALCRQGVKEYRAMNSAISAE